MSDHDADSGGRYDQSEGMRDLLADLQASITRARATEHAPSRRLVATVDLTGPQIDALLDAVAHLVAHGDPRGPDLQTILRAAQRKLR